MRDKPFTRDSTFRLNLDSRSNAQYFQGFKCPFSDLWVGVHRRIEHFFVQHAL